MIDMKFPAQMHNLRKTVMGDNIISVSVDKAFSKDIMSIMEIDPGTQMIVTLEVVTEKEPEQNTQTKDKFRKMMHVLIRDISEATHQKEEEVKKLLRNELVRRNMIKESTSELDIKGYAVACSFLEEWRKSI